MTEPIAMFRASPLYSFRRCTEWVIVFCGVLIMLVACAAVPWFVETERRVEVGHIERELGNLATTFEEQTVRTFEGIDRVLRMLKHDIEQLERSPLGAFDREHYSSAEADGILLQLAVIDSEGMLNWSSLPFKPVSLADREHFLVHRQSDNRGLFVSKPVIGRASGKWSIQLSRRVNRPDGGFGGVVVASVNPEYFVRFFNQIDLGHNGALAALSSAWRRRQAAIRAGIWARRHRPGDEVALRLVATAPAQVLSVGTILHPFGHDLDGEAARHRQAALEDGAARLIAVGAAQSRGPILVLFADPHSLTESVADAFHLRYDDGRVRLFLQRMLPSEGRVRRGKARIGAGFRGFVG